MSWSAPAHAVGTSGGAGALVEDDAGVAKEGVCALAPVDAEFGKNTFVQSPHNARALAHLLGASALVNTSAH